MSTEFGPWNSSTRPLIYPWIDHNAMCDHAFEKEVSYIIRKNGSYYEAIQGGGSTGAGTIVYGGSGNLGADGTDAAAVIQKALDNLTVSRTWKEKAMLKGDLSVGTQISVPSYTEIETQGKITASSALTDAVFYASTKTNIEIYGGEINVNSKDSNGIHLRQGSNCVVRNVLVQGASQTPHIAIIVTGSESAVLNNIVKNSHAGIYVAGENVVASGNRLYNITPDVAIGTELQDWATAPSRYITISGNSIKLASYGVELRNSEHSSVTGNVMYGGLGAGTKGIMISNADPYTTVLNSITGNAVSAFEDGIDLLADEDGVYGNTVDSNMVWGCSNSGIRFQGANYNTATGNQLVSDFCGYDINGDSNVITGGSVRLNTYSVWEREGVDNNQIVGLRCENNTNPMILVGTNTKLNTHDCYDNSYWLSGTVLNIKTAATNLYQLDATTLQTDNNFFALGNIESANLKVKAGGDYYSSDGTGGITDDIVIGAVTLHFKCGICVGHTG